MEFTEDALVLRTANYGENDRMVTLLSAGRGKFGAAMKGVRKAGAKLNFAAQPFCFAEYTVAERSGRKTVTSASLYDGFYALREDMTKYYTAVCVLEACDALLPEEMPSGGMLVSAVDTLNKLCAGEEYVLIGFLLTALRLSGYPVELGADVAFNKFDFESGRFSVDGAGVAVSSSTVSTLRYALGMREKPTADGYKRALRLLRSYVTFQTETDLPTLGELLNIL